MILPPNHVESGCREIRVLSSPIAFIWQVDATCLISKRSKGFDNKSHSLETPLNLMIRRVVTQWDHESYDYIMNWWICTRCPGLSAIFTHWWCRHMVAVWLVRCGEGLYSYGDAHYRANTSPRVCLFVSPPSRSKVQPSSGQIFVNVPLGN